MCCKKQRAVVPPARSFTKCLHIHKKGRDIFHTPYSRIISYMMEIIKLEGILYGIEIDNGQENYQKRRHTYFIYCQIHASFYIPLPDLYGPVNSLDVSSRPP